MSAHPSIRLVSDGRHEMLGCSSILHLGTNVLEMGVANSPKRIETHDWAKLDNNGAALNLRRGRGVYPMPLSFDANSCHCVFAQSGRGMVGAWIIMPMRFMHFSMCNVTLHAMQIVRAWIITPMQFMLFRMCNVTLHAFVSSIARRTDISFNGLN
jgi:hypothetical protein